MYQYTVAQWIFFFFCYSFIGWIWECSYVSIKGAIKEKRWKWNNRGFLNGPVIPIYGFAAISILIATIPFKENKLLIFILGALAASVLELVTGTLMEKTFHVKYWDYSNLPLNYNGRVCLLVSTFWGLLSIMMVRVIHVPVEKILFSLPAMIVEVLTFIFVIIFTYDFKESLQEAMDLKELLEKLDDYKVVVQRMEKRVDALVTFTAVPDMDELKEIPGSAKEKFLFKVEKMRNNHVLRLKKIRDRIEDISVALEEKIELKKQLENQFKEIFKRTDKQYLRARKHLLRNSGAISQKYSEVLKELKELFEDTI